MRVESRGHVTRIIIDDGKAVVDAAGVTDSPNATTIESSGETQFCTIWNLHIIIRAVKTERISNYSRCGRRTIHRNPIIPILNIISSSSGY